MNLNFWILKCITLAEAEAVAVTLAEVAEVLAVAVAGGGGAGGAGGGYGGGAGAGGAGGSGGGAAGEQPPEEPTPVGAFRFNTDTAKLEYYDGNQWVNVTTDSPIKILVELVVLIVISRNDPAIPKYNRWILILTTTGNAQILVIIRVRSQWTMEVLVSIKNK